MVGAVKPAVLTRYKISLRQLRPVLDDKFIDEIGTKMIAKIVSHRKGENVTNATIKRDLTAVSSVLRFCCAQGWIEENAALNYDRTVIRERRDPIALPDPEDIDGLVSFAPRTFGQIIRLAQYTGMRQNEISTLERRQVRGKIIDLWKTKTDRPRAVALDDRALGTLGGTTAHITEPWVFHHDDGLPFVGIKSQFRDLMSRAIKKTIVKNRFKFHDLRHWYAVDYLRRGGNIYDLQQHLGHSSIKTTEVYLAYLTPDEQRIAKFGRSAQSRHTYTGSSPSEEKDSALSH
tara:strand:- start:494 stop:1360 length:867 start_codon:yes stop_codon:yes gene_type:complete